AVIWKPFEKGAPVQDLGVATGPNSAAVEVNSNDEAIGWAGNASSVSSNARAILWAGGETYELGVLPGMLKSNAKHINRHTEIVALSNPASGTGLHFFWIGGKTMPIMPPAGYDLVGTADYSDLRQMTGHLRVEGTSAFHPFLWQHGEFFNLNSLIPSLPPGLVVNHGAVLCDVHGLILCGATMNGRVVTVLLQPINPPRTDLNADCRTDHHDLLILLSQWGVIKQSSASGAAQAKADVNDDGFVDVLDLLILLQNWG
ncbi:MAG TPA: dockerin type I domain-containing protein, partial [Phycisphaerales bacterium]|nr:dockerin type I domain-containing protein [Phycisphaerales bacterium]